MCLGGEGGLQAGCRRLGTAEITAHHTIARLTLDLEEDIMGSLNVMASRQEVDRDNNGGVGDEKRRWGLYANQSL
jgi:hypothetical protein